MTRPAREIAIEARRQERAFLSSPPPHKQLHRGRAPRSLRAPRPLVQLLRRLVPQRT